VTKHESSGASGSPAPLIIVISGPGGVGKGTVVGELTRSDPALWVSRSWTTRARRVGESADAYNFVSDEEFVAHVKAGGFLEWVEFLDYKQGSPLPSPPDGHDVVFEIDVLGGQRIKELYPQSLLVFIDAPSRSEQESRLRLRGDSEDRVEQRLAKAEEELQLATELSYELVVNDNLAEAVQRIRGLIDSERS